VLEKEIRVFNDKKVGEIMKRIFMMVLCFVIIAEAGIVSAASVSTTEKTVEPAKSAKIVQPEHLVKVKGFLISKNADTENTLKKTNTMESSKKIIVNLASCSLAFYINNTKVRLYPVAVGTIYTPTPVGNYSILEKEVNPEWISPENEAMQIASGEDNPLGYRWMRFWGNYGIHGTNRPESVGRYVSNGCLRLKEANAEEIFDLVTVGTPVEIMYNRVVIEKNPKKIVTYYIYPDVYSRQPLDVETVNKWLAGYGVDRFVSNQSIAEKIAASDGEPTYIGRAFHIYVNGTELKENGVVKDGIIYLPAIPIAVQLDLPLTWNADTSMLISRYGSATGYIKKDVLYFSADGAAALFNLAGGLGDDDVFKLVSLASSNTIDKPAVTSNASVKKSDKKRL
ncbi:MAG: L,D-transpeptidase, partial [Selenomonadaceae bacterium]